MSFIVTLQNAAAATLDENTFYFVQAATDYYAPA